MLNKSVLFILIQILIHLNGNLLHPVKNKNMVHRWQLGNAQLGNSGYNVSGWIGILKTSKKGEAKHREGASASNAGISIMRGKNVKGIQMHGDQPQYFHLEREVQSIKE